MTQKKEVHLIIPGKPIAKARPRFARKGNFVKTYSIQGTEEGRFLFEVQKQYQKEPFVLPLVVSFVFMIARPKGHFGTGKNKGLLKKSAPEFHSGKPDLDNLIKFASDCCNAVVWTDDAQIYQIRAIKKYCGIDGAGVVETPRTEIRVVGW